MKMKKCCLTWVGVLLALGGVAILYVNPDNPTNKLLFYLAVSFAVSIQLLRRKRAYDNIFFRKKINWLWLGSIVFLGGLGQYLFLYAPYKHGLIGGIVFAVFILVVILFIIKVRKDAGKLKSDGSKTKHSLNSRPGKS